jgi:hypothetical protein
VERALKRRDIRIRIEITEFSSKFESLRFAICSICFDAEITVRYVKLVEWIVRPLKGRYITIRIEVTEFSPKFDSMRFVICRDCFDTEIGVRYVRRVEWSGRSV